MLNERTLSDMQEDYRLVINLVERANAPATRPAKSQPTKIIDYQETRFCSMIKKISRDEGLIQG